MGRSGVQVLAPAQDTGHPLAATHRAPPAWPVCSLALALWTRPNNGSRMTRECHVRFCESAGVRSPRATHLKLPDTLYLAILRSPHAHAVITGIDISSARAAPGVRLALAGTDLVGKIGNIKPNWVIPGTVVT